MDKNAKIPFAKCYDTITLSSQFLIAYYNDLYNKCILIGKDKEKYIPDALSCCWSIIDVINRIREVVQCTPLLRAHKSKVDFLARTKNVENFRNYIQHLRKEIAKNPPTLSPVWGTLSWVDPDHENQSFTLFIGTYIEGQKYYGHTYDTECKKWVSKVSLVINEDSLDYDIICSQTIDFCNFLLEWFKEIDPTLEARKTLSIMSAQIALS